MNVKNVLTTMSVSLCLCYVSSAQVVIDINFIDVGSGGFNGSGYTDAEATRIVELSERWEERLIDYRDDSNAPESIVIDFSALTLDGVGGTLGQANVATAVQTGDFVVSETGFVEFDIDDVNELSDAEFDGVVEHEIGHVLGAGTLWTNNNVYINGTGEYTGEAGLEKYRRDVDPDATFVPIFANNDLPGSDDAHFDEDDTIIVTNEEVSYFGETLADELNSPFLTGSLFVSDFNLGTYEDIGYIVNYELGRELFWDGSATVANGAIDSGVGVWNATNTNWTIENGDINSEFVSRAAVHFEGDGSAITIEGTVNPFETIFNGTGYSLNGGSFDVTEFNSTVTVTNAEDIATFNTTVFGEGSLILDGEGTVVNTGLISADIDIETDATLESEFNTLDNAIDINNEGTLTLNGDNTISNYNSDGGSLQGAGVLTATNYNLSNGAEVLSETGSGTINILSGEATLSATSAADIIVIEDDSTLITQGDILSASPTVNNSGELVIDGDLSVGDYVGTADGGVQGVGELNVTSFAGGSIETTGISNNVLDLTIDANGGVVDLAGSTLIFDANESILSSNLNEFQLINDGVITSGFGSFEVDDNLSGFFDIDSGVLYVLPSGSISSGATPNGTSISNNLFGVSPGGSNFNNVEVTGGTLPIIELASDRQSTIAGVTFDTELEELSPEVYGAVAEYGIQSYRRFLSVPVNGRNAIINRDSKIFGGFSGFDIESSSSLDSADFELQGTGGYFGVENSLSEYTRWGFAIGLDQADISGERLSLDGDGVLGSLYIETFVPIAFNDGRKPGALRASIGFAEYSFDGTRSAQGLLSTVDEIDSLVIHAGVNYKAQLYTGQNGHISSFLGANYLNSDVDSFNETGAINSLGVESFDKDATFVEFGIEGTVAPENSPWGLQGSVRAVFNLGDDGTDITSRFAGSTTPFSVNSPGFSETSYEVDASFYVDLTRKTRFRVSGFTSFGDDFESAIGGNAGITITW